ncbi:hypothetical protein SRHO_G00271900 [Serrasalmus rhombeus]
MAPGTEWVSTSFCIFREKGTQYEQPIKSLLKLFDSTLRNTAAIQKTNKDLEAWLTKVDKSVPLTTTEPLERKISGFLCKWLGLPGSLNSAALYGTNNTLHLPFSSITEEFMVAQTREALQNRDSRNQKVSSVGTKVRTEMKWRAEKAVEVAESLLRQKAGLGYFPKTLVGMAQGKDRPYFIQDEVRAGMEKEHMSRTGSREHGRGGRVYRSIGLPSQISCRGTAISSGSLCKLSTMPYQDQKTFWGKSKTPS